MTVCRYFKNGYCRNEDSCTFRHVYYNQQPALLDTPRYSHGNSSGYAGGPGGGPAGDRRNQPESILTDQILGDIDLMLRKKLYLFTCIAGRQIHLNVKHTSDFSPEEMRVRFLECQASNNCQLFLSEMSSYREYTKSTIREILRNPSLLDDVQSPLVSSTSSLPFANKLFEANLPLAAPASGAAFGDASMRTFPPSFNVPVQPGFTSMATAPQAQAMVPTPNMGIAPCTAPAQTFFGKFTETSGSPFDRERESQPMFVQAASGSPAVPVHEVSPQSGQPLSMPTLNESNRLPLTQSVPCAQSTASTPSSHQENQTQNVDRVYTPRTELSPQDLAAFQDRSFTIAKLPLVPPPREYCF